MLLHDKAQTRRRLAREQQVVAIANGLVIALDKDARDRWNRAHRQARPPQSPGEFSATMARLAAIPGMNVKVN